MYCRNGPFKSEYNMSHFEPLPREINNHMNRLLEGGPTGKHLPNAEALQGSILRVSTTTCALCMCKSGLIMVMWDGLPLTSGARSNITSMLLSMLTAPLPRACAVCPHMLQIMARTCCCWWV